MLIRCIYCIQGQHRIGKCLVPYLVSVVFYVLVYRILIYYTFDLASRHVSISPLPVGFICAKSKNPRGCALFTLAGLLQTPATGIIGFVVVVFILLLFIANECIHLMSTIYIYLVILQVMMMIMIGIGYLLKAHPVLQLDPRLIFP